MKTFIDQLEHAFIDSEPARIIVSDPKTAWTLEQFLSTSKAWREALEASSIESKTKRVVAIALEGGPAFTALQLAAWDAGWIAWPIPPKSTGLELEHFFSLVEPDLIVVSQTPSIKPNHVPQRTHYLALTEDDSKGYSSATALDALLKPDFTARETSSENPLVGVPDNACMLQATSGSTGLPKLIILSKDNVKAAINGHAQSEPGRLQSQNLFCAMPQFHAMGGAVTLEYLLNGTAIHMSHGFMPGADLNILSQRHCDAIACAPSYFRIAARLGVLQKPAMQKLRAIVLGSAATENALLTTLFEALPQLKITLRYGLSEAFGALTQLTLDAHCKRLPHSVGTPMPDVRFEADANPSDTSLTVNTPRAATGIITDDQAGWHTLLSDAHYLDTGDLGHFESRELILKGRQSQFIKRNGYRVDPLEIEQLVKDQLAVEEAVVIGTPDPLAGQKISLVTLISGGTSDGSEVDQKKQILKLCRQHLSAYKIPQRIIVTDTLPRTAAGKPDITKIKSEYTSDKPLEKI